MIDADRRIGQVDQEHARAALRIRIDRLRHDDAHLRAIGPGDEALRRSPPNGCRRAGTW
jgi:hypothetical protein